MLDGFFLCHLTFYYLHVPDCDVEIWSSLVQGNMHAFHSSYLGLPYSLKADCDYSCQPTGPGEGGVILFLAYLYIQSLFHFNSLITFSFLFLFFLGGGYMYVLLHAAYCVYVVCWIKKYIWSQKMKEQFKLGQFNPTPKEPRQLVCFRLATSVYWRIRAIRSIQRQLLIKLRCSQVYWLKTSRWKRA